MTPTEQVKGSLTPRLRFFVVPLGLLLLLLTLLRLVFWVAFDPADLTIPASQVTTAFYLGLKLDLRLCLLLLLPCLALAGLPRLNPCRDRWARRFWIDHCTLLAGLLVLFAAIDLGNYAYLGEHLDAASLRYLHNPLISLQMVWQSYPVVWGLLGLVALALVFRWTFSRLAPAITTTALAPSRRWPARAVVGLVVIGCLAGLYGKLSWYPLRWSDAFFSSNRFVADLALDPVLFFVNSLGTAEQEIEYDRAAVAASYDTVADYLGMEERDPVQLSFARRVRPTPLGSKRPNVVLILAESLAAHKTGIFGNRLDPSPNLDRIAADSLLFTSFYTPRQGTARAVFAVLTGIPDTITHRTASRNPRTITHQVVLNSLSDYETFYFLGGSASWANIRALFQTNVNGIHLVDEGSFTAPRVDVWGITDVDLLEEANRRLREQQDRPFFAFLHLSGNHRPYTVPDDVPGFDKLTDVSESTLHTNGFHSLEELNSFRFLDFAIGHYLELAQHEVYFRNTLFFMLSDNGGWGHSQQMTPAEISHDLGLFHAPLLIYGPGFLSEGKVIRRPVSQIDLLPTIAGAVGIPALNTTLGRNLLDPRFNEQGVAFFYRKRGPKGEIGLIDEQHLLLVAPDGSDPRLYSLDRNADPTLDLGDHLPEQRQGLQALALGLYHSSKLLLYENRPERYRSLTGNRPAEQDHNR